MNLFRVMSFNIRGSFIDDGDNVWPARAKLNCDTIKKYSPDLIGFQELQTGNWETYEESLAGYDRILGPQYNNVEPFCYPSIFYNTDKFKAVDQGHFWLSETPHEFSSAWDTEYIRSALWVRLQYKDIPDATVLYLNTHLDNRSERARTQGSRLIIDKLSTIRAENESILVSGDFNCKPGSEAYTAFLSAGYADTYISAGNSDEAGSSTFHGFKGLGSDNYPRIDWILAQTGSPGLDAVESNIIRDANPPLYPSDHYPIIMDYVLKNS